MGVKERFEERKKQLENSATDAKNSPAPATSTRYEGVAERYKKRQQSQEEYEGVAERYAKRQRSQEENDHESGVSSPNSGGSAGQGAPTTARNNEPSKTEAKPGHKSLKENEAGARAQIAQNAERRRAEGQGDLFAQVGGTVDYHLGNIKDFLFGNEYAKETERINDEAKRLYGALTSADAPLSLKGESGKSVIDSLSDSKKALDGMEQRLGQMLEEYKRNPSEALAAQYDQLAAQYNQAVAEHNKAYAQHEPQLKAYNDALNAYNAYVTEHGDRISVPMEDEYSPYREQLDALESEITRLGKRKADIHNALSGLSRAAQYGGAVNLEGKRKEYADEIAAIDAQLLPLEARRNELVKEGGYLSDDDILGGLAYGGERFLAGALGMGENITDFIGTTLYGALEGVTSLGGYAPNPVSKWAGNAYDSFAGNSITADYEESIRQRYKPTPKDEELTGFMQTVEQVALPIAAGYGISQLAGLGSGAAAGSLAAPNTATIAANATKGVFGANAAGGATREAHAAGASHAESLTYGWLIGAMEMSIEEISGAIPGLPDGSKAANVVKKVFSDPRVHAVVSHPAVQRLLGGVGEGAEETLSAIFTPYIQRATYDPNAPLATAEEIGEQALIGGLASLCIGAGIDIPAYVAESIYARNRLAVDEFDAETIRGIIETGLESPADSVSHKLATELQQKGDSVTAQEIMGLYNENVKQVNAENAEQGADEAIMDAAREAVGAVTEAYDNYQPAQEENAVEAPQNEAQAIPYNLMPIGSEQREQAVKQELQRRTAESKRSTVEAWTGYGEYGTEAFTDIAEKSGQDLDLVRLAFQSAYEMGTTDTAVDESRMNSVQLAAYKAGQLDRLKNIQRANLKARETYIWDDGLDTNSIPAEVGLSQREIDDARYLFRALGVKGGFGKTGGNASITDKGVVTIAADFGISDEKLKALGNMSHLAKVKKLAKERGRSFISILAHELAVHRTMQLAPTEFRAFMDAMYRNAGKDLPAAFGTLAQQKQEKYGEQGVSLTTDKAIEEIVADLIVGKNGLYKTDAEFMAAVRKAIEGAKTAEEAAKVEKGARTWLDSIKAFLRKLGERIKVLKGAQKEQAQQVYDEVSELKNLFETALKAATDRVTAARESGGAPNGDAQIDSVQNSLKNSSETAGSETITTSLVNDGEVSLSDVRNLFDRLNSNKDLALLAEKVFATAERLGVNIRFTSQMMEPKNRLGFGQNIGFAVGDMVEYLTPAFNSGATNQAKANVLVHELIHTCSLYAMTNGYQSKSLANAAKRMERIYLEIRNDPDFAGQYGLSNVREMVAELSNEDFVNLLKAKKNLWDKIVDWFCDLFGIQHDSNAYERLRKSLDTMLVNPDVKTYKEHAVATRRTGESMGRDVFGSTQYSMKDSEGHDLTQEQAEYFKDSKVRDSKGNLKIMYHGTDADFTIFDRGKLKDGLGFFFTEDKREAADYGTPKGAYLNITKPFDMYGDTPIEDFLGDAPKYLDGHFNYGAAVKGLREAGYDGLYAYSHGTEWYVAFDSNQIKDIDNTNPTSDPDIRFSLKESGITMTEEEYLDLHDVQYNLKAEESHKVALKKNYSAAESVVSRDALMARYEKTLEIWRRIGGELNSKFLEDWNNKTDRVFTIFKAQQGYKYNVELSSMCKKGVPLFEAIDTIVKQEVMRELKLDVLGKAEKEVLYDILKQHNFEIPCAICYVEQARQREGIIIDAFLNGNTEDGKSKLGWNTVLDDIEAEMKANGVDYKFQNVSRSIATEKYTPADIAMDEKTLSAFHAAVQKLANKEIRRYNKEEGKSRRLLKEVTPAAVKECFKGTLPSNLKIFKTLLTEPSSRFRIGKDLLYSSMTTMNLSALHNGLYGLFNAQGGVSGYKTKQGTTVYWGELLGKRWNPDTVRKEGGIRQQSNSDFQMFTFLDKAQMYIDHTAKGYYVQEYSKVLAELKLFGLSGAKLNASLIPKVVEYKNADGSVDVERTMLTAGLDESGNPIYDDIEGINHAEAFMLLEDPNYSRNICGICIGYSDKHIEKLLDDSRVQMIIGFHDKTNDPDKRYRGARYAKNYNGLNEAVADNGAGKTVHIGFNPYLQKAEKRFTRNESTKRFEGTTTFGGKQYVANDIPRLAADMYLADCAKKGYRPAYNDFTGHPNYYKLLSDIGLYDSLGQYAPHEKVAYRLPDRVPYLDKSGNKRTMSTEEYIKTELQKELAVRDSIAEALADTSENGIIPQFKAAVAQANAGKVANETGRSEDGYDTISHSMKEAAENDGDERFADHDGDAASSVRSASSEAGVGGESNRGAETGNYRQGESDYNRAIRELSRDVPDLAAMLGIETEKTTVTRKDAQLAIKKLPAEDAKIATEARMRATYSRSLSTMSVERLDSVYADYSYPGVQDKTRAYLTYIEPLEFLGLTTTSVDEFLEENPEGLNEGENRQWGGPNNIYNTDKMYLRIDDSGNVVGHEGRHRMAALHRAGVERVAIVLNLDDDASVSHAKPISIKKLLGQKDSGITSYDSVYIHNALPVSKEYETINRYVFGGVSKDNTLADPNIQFSLKDDGDLIAENAKLKEVNQALREQFKVTKLAKVDKKSLEKFSKQLLKDWQSRADITETRDALEELYTFIRTEMEKDEPDMAAMEQKAYEVAEGILTQSVEVDDQMYQDYKELRSRLRTTGISIDPSYGSSLMGYEDLQDFRKRNMGRIKLRKDGLPVDVLYQELASTYPDLFNEAEHSNPADQLVHLAEVLEEMRPIEVNPYKHEMREAATWLATDIMHRIYELPQAKPTFADKAAAKLSEQKAKDKQKLYDAVTGERMAAGREMAAQKRMGQQKLTELREKKNERISKLIADSRDKMRLVQVEERVKRETAVKTVKEHYRAKEAKASESRQATILRAKIVRHLNPMIERVTKATNKKHIPDNLKGTVIALLESINTGSSYSYDPATLREIARSDGKSGGMTGERVPLTEGVLTKRTVHFMRLQDLFTEIKANGLGNMSIDPSLLGSTEDGIPSKFQEVIKMGDKPLSEMNLKELTTVWEVLRATEHAIFTANKAFASEKRAEIDAWANSFEEDTESRKQKRALTKQHWTLDIETPYTFFSHFGEAGNDLWRMLRAAQDDQYLKKRKLDGWMGDIASKEDRKKLTSEKDAVTFDTARGEKLTLTRAHIMEVYLLSQRKAALSHLVGNGIRQPKVGKIDEGTTAIRLTEMDVAKIASSLSEEEKATADKFQALTKVLAEWANEAHLKVFGYQKFGDPNYWPIKSSSLQTKKDVGQKADNRSREISNIGAAKELIPHASNAVDLPGIFDTFDQHASEMLTYAAWLAPMEDAKRLLNYRFMDEDGTTRNTMAGLLDYVTGKGGAAYWQDLMVDIQNGLSMKPETAADAVIGRAMSTVKRSAVAANARVVIQQPTAYARAALVLDPDIMLLAAGKAATVKSAVAGWKKAVKLSPIAMMKQEGGYEIAANPKQLGESLYQSETKWGKIKDFAKEAGMALPGAADAFTWGIIWNACEMQVKRNSKDLAPGTASFDAAVKALFEDVIEQTQVVDGVLQRSAMMRAGSVTAKSLASFTGEPTQSANMVVRAYDKLRYETDPKKRGKAIKGLSRAAAVYVVNAVLNAFAQSLVDGFRDDDDDKDYWERVWAAFHGINGDEETWRDFAKAIRFDSNVASGLSPLGWLPLTREVMSLIQGYSVERLDTSAIADVITSAQNLDKAISGDGKQTVGYALLKTGLTGLRLFGSGASNFVRDIEGAVRSVQVGTKAYKARYDTMKLMYQPENNKSQYMDVLYNAYQDGGDDYEKILDDMLKGDYFKGEKTTTQEYIMSAMDDRLMEEQGVKKVSELDQRFLFPDQQKGYDSRMAALEKSGLWDDANKKQRNGVKADLYGIVTESKGSEDMREKIAKGKPYDLDETEYLLYQLALEMHDKPNDKGKLGTYTSAERADALLAADLGDDEMAFLWDSKKGYEALDDGISMEHYIRFAAGVASLVPGVDYKKGNSASRKAAVKAVLRDMGLTPGSREYKWLWDTEY